MKNKWWIELEKLDENDLQAFVYGGGCDEFTKIAEYKYGEEINVSYEHNLIFLTTKNKSVGNTYILKVERKMFENVLSSEKLISNLR